VDIDTGLPRSRRAILAGGLGGFATLMAGAIGRASPVQAANGGNAILGAINTSTVETEFTTGDAGQTPIYSHANNAPGSVRESSASYGVLGISSSSTGVRGTTTNGNGVDGLASAGIGVFGKATSGIGVQGETAAAGGATAGVYGKVTASTGTVAGVWGQSASPTGIGVYGETTDTGSSENYGVVGVSRSSDGRAVFGWNQSLGGGSGVWGQTNAGTGAAIRGYAWDGEPASGQFGTGVIGTSGSHAFPPPAVRTNTGVMGYSPAGTGGYFKSDTGVALATSGKVTSSRSGRATIAKNATYIDVTVAGGLAGTPLCFATLQSARTGVYVSSVVPTSSTGKIRIRLNKVASTTSGTYVAWQVLA
jgi:hypothetical protein